MAKTAAHILAGYSMHINATCTQTRGWGLESALFGY